MDKDIKNMIIFLLGFLTLVMAFQWHMDSIIKEDLIMVTKVTKYPNRIFIYSYDTSIGFARFPYGHSMDQLYIIETGNTYRIIYNGFKVFSVEIFKGDD